MANTDVVGRLELRRRAGLGFPWATLIDADGRSLLDVGRLSALNVFLGRGQRIRLGDGRVWRLRGHGWHRYVCPMLVDEARRKLATSAPGVGDYAITCRRRAFALIPAEKRPGRPRRWELLEFDEPVATVRRNPFVADVVEPLPLPALLMAWGLATIGVMGERELIQQMGWTGPVGH